MEAATATHAAVLLVQLEDALDAGRLESVLGAMRGLEHLVGLVGIQLAAAMFAKARDKVCATTHTLDR